jgi:hypothetical protein
VLRERSSRVPWRQVIVGAIRDRAGNGRAALPERLEGAVYGQLVGRVRGEAAEPPPVPGASVGSGSIADDGDPGVGRGATSSDVSVRVLAVLDRLLDQPSHPGGETAFEGGAARCPEEALPIPLVMRGREPCDVVGRTVGPSGPLNEVQVASALYALVVRRFIAGERGRAGVLAHAGSDLRAALASRDAPDSPVAAVPDGNPAALDSLLTRKARPGEDRVVADFRSGWEAFATSAGYADAVTRAQGDASSHRAPAAGIAGGLAGAYWGSSGIPPAWRRGLPQEGVLRSLVDRLVETDAPGWDGRPWRTSTASPLRVDPLDLTGLDGCGSGAVGITFLPGRRYVGFHTGAQWRDLDTDAARLREVGVDVLLLLVEDRELVRCRVTGIGEALAAQGVELARFPIRDPLLPRDGLAFHGTIAALLARVRGGASLAIACRGGLDRAGMAAACLLREAGLDADDAIERVHRARPRALTLPDQQAYVRDWPPKR